MRIFEGSSLLTIQASGMPWIITIFDLQRSTYMKLKQVTKTFVPVAALLLLLSGTYLLGQQQNMDTEALRKSSLDRFEEKDYRAALTGFRSLMEQGDRGEMTEYYAGRCLVALNEGLDEAVELLYGSSRENVPVDAVFYLGRAYQLNYNFHDAIRCYEQYERMAGRQERKLLDVKHLIETCRSAMEITSSYNPYEVMNVTFLDLSDSLQFSQVKMKGGDLGRKPGLYFRDDEDRMGFTALMFRPGDPVRGDYMYFSGYGKSGKDGAQIFRVRKGATNTWGDPQELESLNSPGDEILPYFDPIENDLYFASDGRNGVGGFDLYKSHFDAERDQWTQPVNLGFPVNSTADEFLLLPGSDLGMVLFFSNRQGTDSTVTVYRVHLTEPRRKINSDDPGLLREIAMMGGVASEILAELEAPDVPVVPARGMTGSGDEPAGVPDMEIREPSQADRYQETLALALRHQAVSDSLKDLAGEARLKVRQSDDPNDKWVWQKQVMVWEKRARDEEEQADQLYARMNEELRKEREDSEENLPEAIQVDRIIDGLTVYRYARSYPGGTGEAGEVAPAPATSSLPEPLNNFEILDRSPYSEGNPIPMDEAIPSGTCYRIQLGAYGVSIAPDLFGGISPVTGLRSKENGLVKYYAGKFSRYEDASTAVPRIHSLGFEDAFIVAWYNGIQVTTQKAKQLE